LILSSYYRDQTKRDSVGRYGQTTSFRVSVSGGDVFD